MSTHPNAPVPVQQLSPITWDEDSWGTIFGRYHDVLVASIRQTRTRDGTVGRTMVCFRPSGLSGIGARVNVPNRVLAGDQVDEAKRWCEAQVTAMAAASEARCCE